ncbi:MAG: site-2 protease family protein [Sedimentisphaerales bacterium]|nr:site-2 protease family protein [Sedimentisphaerales bacterium]
MPKINIEQFLITLAVVLPSLTVHEFAHAWTAYKFGDDTAKRMGRLTLNPIAHIDLFGTIILPLIAHFGYAKPVPVNFSILTRGQMLLVAIAGPLSNLSLAIVLAIAFHVLPLNGIPLAQYFLLVAVFLNIVFAVFNLIPIPPLDGSRIIYASLKSEQAVNMYKYFSGFGMIAFILLLVFGGFSIIILPVADLFFKLFRLPLLF